MKFFLVLSLAIASALAVPSGYGQVRVETTVAPVIRNTYAAAPAPVVRAPVVSSYAAPAPVVRAPPPAPIVSSYEAPRAAPAYGGYGESSELKAELKPEIKSAPMIPIVRHVHDTDHKGTYNLHVETGHGIQHQETGSLKDLNSEEGPVGVKSGSYSYTSPEGQKFTVQWTADEHGFHATGAHLPTPPPIPEAIQKSLALPRLPEHELDGPKYVPEKAPVRAAPMAAPASYGGYSAPAPVRVEAAPAPVRVEAAPVVKQQPRY